MNDLTHHEAASTSRSVERLRLGDESASAKPFGVLLDEFPEKCFLRELALNGMELGSGGRGGRAEPTHDGCRGSRQSIAAHEAIRCQSCRDFLKSASLLSDRLSWAGETTYRVIQEAKRRLEAKSGQFKIKCNFDSVCALPPPLGDDGSRSNFSLVRSS